MEFGCVTLSLPGGGAGMGCKPRKCMSHIVHHPSAVVAHRVKSDKSWLRSRCLAVSVLKRKRLK